MNNKTKVVIKERDEWSGFAEFLGNMIAKYADVMDFDSLPDPDIYLLNREIRKLYRAYMKRRNDMRKRAYFVEADIEIKAAA